MISGPPYHVGNTPHLRLPESTAGRQTTVPLEPVLPFGKDALARQARGSLKRNNTPLEP